MGWSLRLVLLVGFLATSGCGGKSVYIIVIADGGVQGTASDDASSSMPAMQMPAKPMTVAEACQGLCDHFAKSNCIHANCAGSCQQALGSTSCSDAYVKFLTCALEPQFICDSNGVAQLQNQACLAEKNAFYQCRTGQKPVVYPDVTEPDPPIMEDAGFVIEAGRPTACPNIPPVPDGVMCSGSDGDAGADPEPYPMCSRKCEDGKGNIWSAECFGGKCACRYADQFCACPQKQFECNLDCCF